MFNMTITIDMHFYSPEADVTNLLTVERHQGAVENETDIVKGIKALNPVSDEENIPVRYKDDVYMGHQARLIKLFNRIGDFVLGGTYTAATETVNWVLPQHDPIARSQLCEVIRELRHEAEMNVYCGNLVSNTADIIGLSLTDIPDSLEQCFQPRRGMVERLAMNYGIVI